MSIADLPASLTDQRKAEEPEIAHPSARRQWTELDAPWEFRRSVHERHRLVRHATELAEGWKPAFPAKYVYSDQELAALFRNLADQWHRDTLVLSSLQAKTLHPAYLRIVGLGLQALPFILKELQVRPAQWFVALNSIAGTDPVGPNDDFPTAIRKWMRWGVDHGYIVD